MESGFRGFQEIHDPNEFYLWLRELLELNGIDTNRRSLLLLDIIRSTDKFHCFREIQEPTARGLVEILNNTIIKVLNFSLGTVSVLQNMFEGIDLQYMGDKGDQVNITGNLISILLLTLILKTSQYGKDLRLMMLGDDSDWVYRQEEVLGKLVHNLILDHDKLNQMPTKDLAYSTSSILFSPSLHMLTEILLHLGLIDNMSVPNLAINKLFSNFLINKTDPLKIEVDQGATLIIKAEGVKEDATRYVLSGLDPKDVFVNFDSGRKNLSWVTIRGGVDSDYILANARSTFGKFNNAVVFYTSNLTVFAELINGFPLCLDPYATAILSRLLIKKFTPGVYAFNQKSNLIGFSHGSVENHIGLDEPYLYFGNQEM